jgi:uncharacterized protein
MRMSNPNLNPNPTHPVECVMRTCMQTREANLSPKARHMIGVIDQHLAEIRALCRHYGVRRLDLFGSAATGEFDPETSDLDFVATFADTDVPGYADRYVDFAEALEALFGRPVEVVIDRSIRNPRFRQAVDAARQPVYDDRNALAVA